MDKMPELKAMKASKKKTRSPLQRLLMMMMMMKGVPLLRTHQLL